MVFDKKQYSKEYRLANKDKAVEYQKQYSKQYRLNNVEKLAEYQKTYGKEYRQSKNGKKIERINKWKHRGVITENFNELYEKYINTTNCDNCDIELIHGSLGANKKCLDHDHKTGQFRNILCHGCNIRRK